MPSIVLAVTTSTARQGVAIAIDGAPAATRTSTWRRGQPRTLLRDITELLAEVGKSLTDIDCIVCDVGPGSFTGLRFSMATARALSWSLKTPCFGVGSLQTMAFMAEKSGSEGPVLAVLPARRRVVYARLADNEAEVPVDELAEWIAASSVTPTTVVGPAASLAEIEHLGLPRVTAEAPDVEAMVALVALPDAAQAVDWSGLTPRYVALSQPERLAGISGTS